MAQDCITQDRVLSDQIYRGREPWAGYRFRSFSIEYFNWWNRYSEMESYTG